MNRPMNQYGNHLLQDSRKRPSLPKFDPRDNMLLKNLTDKHPYLNLANANPQHLSALWKKIKKEYNSKSLHYREVEILRRKFKSISQANNKEAKPHRTQEVVRNSSVQYKRSTLNEENARTNKFVHSSSIFEEIDELRREKRQQEISFKKESRKYFKKRMNDYYIVKMNLFNAEAQYKNTIDQLERVYDSVLERYKMAVGRDWNPLSNRVLKNASQEQAAVEQQGTEETSEEWTAAELEKFDDDLNFFLEGTDLQIAEDIDANNVGDLGLAWNEANNDEYNDCEVEEVFDE